MWVLSLLHINAGIECLPSETCGCFTCSTKVYTSARNSFGCNKPQTIYDTKCCKPGVGIRR